MDRPKPKSSSDEFFGTHRRLGKIRRGDLFNLRTEGGKDVFVHISAVEKAGLSTLNEGQTVEYEEVPNKGKTSAENLKVV